MLSRFTSATLVLLLALPAGCDTRLFGTDERALVDLTPGPQRGTVGRDRTPADPVDPPVERPAPDPTLEAALARLDDVRAALDLPAPLRQAALTAAAQAHADYVVQNQAYHVEHGLSPHAEDPELSGFTGASPGERVDAAQYDGVFLGEVIGYQPTPLATMEAWLESLYHRLPLLRLEAVEVGAGAAAGDALLAHVVEVGSDTDTFAAVAASGTDRLIAYPPDGALDVPTSWSGLEMPQPAPPPAGYPSGPVLSLSSVSGELTVTSAALRPLGGQPVAATVLTHANDAYLQPRDVALIPHAPLDPATVYELAVVGTLAGQPFAWTSTFTTQSDTCQLDANDCSPGRACYPFNGSLRCLWEGTAGVDDSCRYLDDCAAGLTCIGSRCRPLCEDDCAARCPDEPTLATSAPGVSVCLGPACTSESCGPDQGCYWLSSLTCGWAGDLGFGATCTYANDCRAGLTCLGATGAPHACYALCDGPGMPDCANVCTSAPLTLDAATGLKACL